MPLFDVRQAAGKASEFFTQAMSAKDIRLEEIEVSDDDQWWSVTLSGLVPAALPPGSASDDQPNLAKLMFSMSPQFERIYRTFRVSQNTGEVRGMRIRHLTGTE